MLDSAKEIRSLSIESVKHNIEWIASNLILEIRKETLKEDISSHLYYYKSCSAHKMYELSLAAIEFIEVGKLSAAANLIRATQETAAALHYVASTMFESLNIGNTTSIWACLEKLAVRAEEFRGFTPNSKTPEFNNSVEILKEILEEADLEEAHKLLSEVVHPNALGTTVFYTCIDNKTSLAHLGYKNFIKEEHDHQNGLRDICIISLKEALACFRASFINIQNYRGELDKHPPHNQKVPLSPWVEPNLFPFENNILSLSQEKPFLEFIRRFIKYLNATLVKELNLEIFKSGIPSRLLHYKSVMTHRIHELSVLALEKIEENKIIVAMCLIRTTMETASALKYIRKKMDNSLKEKDISILNKALNRAAYGVKNSLESFSNTEFLKSQHVNDFLRTQNKKFRMDHSFLCEFIHPTPIGITRFYTCLKHSNSSHLLNCSNCKQSNDNRSILRSWSKSLCIKALGNSLACFIEEEKIVHQNMMRLVEVCIQAVNRDQP